MKNKLFLLKMIFLFCCMCLGKMQGQQAFGIDASFESNTVNTFDLLSPATTTPISTLSVDFFITGGAYANDTWYITYIDFNTFESFLGTINTSNGTLTAIGTTTGALIFDIAFDATTSTMYALGTFDFFDFDLYTIDLSNGSDTFIANVGNEYSGLAIDDTGTLYTFNGWLHTINKTNGALSPIGNTFVGLSGSNFPNLEFDIANSTLYLTGVFNTGNNLYSVSTSTGEATLVGAYAGSVEMLALAIPESNTVIQNDIAIDALLSPQTGYSLSSSEQITIRVLNLGANAQSNIPVTYTINNGDPISEIIPGPIAPDDQIDYTFTQTADLSNVQTYSIEINSNLPDDEVTFNNSITEEVINLGLSDDLTALSVSGPLNPFSNSSTLYTVFVKNIGEFSQSGTAYTVSLFDENDNILATEDGVLIASGETKSFDFNITFNSVGPTFIYSQVFLTGDLDITNDRTSNLSILVLDENLSSSNEWTQTGPSGINFVNTIGGDEDNLFVGFNGGLYRSIDQGQSWDLAGFRNENVSFVTKIGNSIFASVGQSVYRSDDDGETWENKSNGLPNSPKRQIVSVGSFIFVGINSATPALRGVYRSADNGESWTSMGVTFIADKLGANENSLFVGGLLEPLRRSDDFGVTWNILNNGLGTDNKINAFASSGTAIFVGTNNYLYRSINNGASWTIVQEGSFIEITATSTHVHAGRFMGFIPGGVATSSNDGLDWVESDFELNPSVVAIHSVGNTVIAGLVGGISRSLDNASNWIENSSFGINALTVTNLQQSETKIFLNTQNGINRKVFVSNDDGGSWSIFKIENNIVINILKISEQAWAASTNNGTQIFNYLSYDDGDTWIFTPANLLDENIYRNVKALNNTLFAGVIQPDFSTVASRSNDNGITWSAIPELTVGEFLNWDTSQSVKFASIFNNGVFKSTDDGATWSQTSGLPTTIFNISAIEFQSKILMAISGGGQTGVYHSFDNGTTWSLASSQVTVSRFISNNTDLFAVGFGESIFHSTDQGISWNDIGSSIVGLNRNSLNIFNSNLYVNLSNGGVLASTNNGISWFTVNNGFFQDFLPSIAIPIQIGQDNMIVGTIGQSSWRRSLDTFQQPAQPSQISGISNPCTNSTQTYSVENIPSITYTWQVPNDWIILSGQNTNSITVTVGASAGVILVTASNEFGSSPAQTFNVNPFGEAPSQPSPISGDNTPCINSIQIYSVLNVTGVDYTWSIPADWILISGDGTNIIEVEIGNLSGSIAVTPSNTCDAGIPQSLAVTATSNPLPPGDISGPVNPNPGTVQFYSVENQPGINYNWTIPNDWSLINGQGTSAIGVTVGSDSGDIICIPSNECGEGEASLLNVEVQILSITDNDFINAIKIYPNPANNNLFIELKNIQGNTSILIRDIQGKALLKTEIDSNSAVTQIDISNLKTGIYLIQLTNEDRTHLKKLIVK